MAIASSALLSAYLLVVVFDCRRRVCDLLLVFALVTLSLVDFVFAALPALSGIDTAAHGAAARLACELVVSIAFAAAAFAPSATLTGHGRRPLAVSLIAAMGMAGVAALAELMPGSHWAQTVLSAPGVAGPVASFAHLLCSGVLLTAGIALVVRAGPQDTDAELLAAAAFLLAASGLEYIALPVVFAGWVTPGVAVRVGASGLLLAVAYRRDARAHNAARWAAISEERQRIARDLHDGLAQDLALIAGHAPQLLAELGADHPVVIAARRTLAVSRGAIVDLSASAAPNTGAALREIANELSDRFGVHVNVEIKPIDRQPNRQDLEPSKREEVVRIAREAIVNAVRHGGAGRIDVELDYRGPDLLRVSDDGCGIEEAVASANDWSGFGLPAMHARAASIGGRLLARRKADGGTEVKVRVP